MSIKVTDVVELRALLQAVYVAKAFGSKWKPELLGSQSLARISHEVVDALNQLATRTGAEETFALSDERRYLNRKDQFWLSEKIWDAAVERLRSNPGAWAEWEINDKADYVKLIFSPMLISPELVSEFVRNVDGRASNNVSIT